MLQLTPEFRTSRSENVPELVAATLFLGEQSFTETSHTITEARRLASGATLLNTNYRFTQVPAKLAA